MPETFNEHNFIALCNLLADKDEDLGNIIQQYGYPTFWSRTVSFETLVHIILEQQVSLASALAALNKLKEKITDVTPENVLLLSDEEMKACYFSRQKALYTRLAAHAAVAKQLSFDGLALMTDEDIRFKLKLLKGIGDWTVDVFLMMALHRCNLFPIGDIALIKSIKEVKNLPINTTKEDVLMIAGKWQPYRTIATYLLWWNYINKRKKIVK